MDAVKTLGRALRPRVLMIAAVLVLADPSPFVVAKEPEIPSPQPPFPGPGDVVVGTDLYVPVHPGDDLRAKLRTVSKRGALVLHAGAGGTDDGITHYRLDRALRVGRGITIMAAPGDEGYVQLDFPSHSSCFEIAPFPKRPRAGARLSSFAEPDSDPAADVPTAPDDEEDTVDQPDNEPAYYDQDMCRGKGEGRRWPTPKNTVALCGLRIVRAEPPSENAGRAPACISVYRRQLYMANMKVQTGFGSGLDVRNSPGDDRSPTGVRMGTAQPGGIDRSVVFVGSKFYASDGQDTSTFGVRIDRKSQSLLQWTQIMGFGTGIQTDGHLDLQRGVEIDDTHVGILINGGKEDADIFGPRNITIGVNEEVAGAKPNPRHWEPDISAPQLRNNDIGIRVAGNFEGKIEVRRAQIDSKFEQIGIQVDQTKYKTFLVSVRNVQISGMGTAIQAAAPVRIGPGVIMAGNKFDVDFKNPNDDLRVTPPPYTIDGVLFDQFDRVNGRTALQFSGFVDNTLRLCNIAWPRIGTFWDDVLRVRVKSEGIQIGVTGPNDGFAKCYVDDLPGLRASLSKQNRKYFDQVCKAPIPDCPIWSDLMLASLELKNSSISTGKSVDVSFAVANTGESISGGTMTAFYVVRKDRFNPDRPRFSGEPMAVRPIPSLEPGKTWNESFSLTSDAGLKPGKYLVVAVVNYLKNERENTYDNNWAAAELDVSK